MKRLSAPLLAASLLLAVPAGYAANKAGAEPVWPENAGPTLTLEQLRMQIQMLTPRERQQLLRNVAPDFRPGFSEPEAPQRRNFAPGGPNGPGPGPNGPARWPGEVPRPRDGGFTPNGPFQDGNIQRRRPDAGDFVPNGPAQGVPDGRRGRGAQRPMANLMAEIANLPPEQRAERMGQMRQRLNNRLAELRRQRESGALGPEQQQQLQNLETNSRRLEELSHLPPAELDARLNAMRNGRPQASGFRGNEQALPPQGQRPRRPFEGPGQDFDAPEQPRRPFAPLENDPYGLPPQPRPPTGPGQPPPQN